MTNSLIGERNDDAGRVSSRAGPDMVANRDAARRACPVIAKSIPIFGIGSLTR
jgi:hypothetical protein